MGQQNEIEEAQSILTQLNLFEEKLVKENIFSEDSFLIAKTTAKEYINYKTIIDKYQKKKQDKNSKENIDRNKLDEINHKFDRINKWIKMAKTPYVSNFQHFLNKIKGEDKKVKNKGLFKDKSTDNIFNNKPTRRKNNKLDYPETDRNNRNNEITIKKKKRKKTTSLDKYKIKEEQDKNEINENEDNNNNLLIQNYSDKSIEEKIITFYSHNKSKFKERLSKGPPDCFRWLSWCIINEIPLERDINIYNNYLVKDLEEEHKNSIIRDIQRTFSDINIDKDELIKKETSLYNVLKAFWNLDDQIGYCQGMNLLVGFMLIISEGNELDTFYLLISNFSATFNKRKSYEYSLRGLFSEGFPLLAFLNFIFDILLEENIPEVKNHLDEMGITYDLWIGQWFQTLFTIILPLNYLKRIWDCLFSENIYFLVKFGIVFTKMIKNDILEKTEEIDIINFFKDLQKFSMFPENKFLETKSDINTLITKANKIKLDPEEYIKLYRKRYENYNEFKIEMDKNNGVLYPLEIGNRAWNDFKINNRNTILFEKEDKKEKKDNTNLLQIKELYNEDENEEKNIIEDEDNNKNKDSKNDNISYDPLSKQISIKIKNKKNSDEIKIKPLLERKNNIQIDNNKTIKKAKNIKEIFENMNDNNNNIIPQKAPVYIKKKITKEHNFNENKINIKNNIDINADYNNFKNINNNGINMNNINNNNININNNYNNIINNNINYISNYQNNDFSDNYNSVYKNFNKKYYNVNLKDDNANLNRYYFPEENQNK